MKALTFLLPQVAPPPPKITKQTLSPPPQTNYHKPPQRTWRLGSGAKGFTSDAKDGDAARRRRSSRYDSNNRNEKPKIKNGEADDDDDKISEVVWQRMISRIVFYVGVPMAVGLGFLQLFSVMKEGGIWDVPRWLPFLTSLVSFGSSALGIAYGSLSTSLDENEEGSLLGFEQVEKNWVEVWKEEGDS